MMKKIVVGVLLFISGNAYTATYNVSGVISKMENYGSQLSIFLTGQTIPSNACGLTDRFAISPIGSEINTYKALYSSILTYYSMKNTVTVIVTDEACTGDRTRITYISAE